ncbi:MAG: NUDIX hydrolase [Chloroflexi bacterium]|nr:NUDIX hydrolase [Chloroflexota bacterium]
MMRGRVYRAVSAGGVVFRWQDDHIEFALVGYPKSNFWALPKGTPDTGESFEEAALRETREESGLEARIVASLGTIDYWFVEAGRRYHKWVHYFLMEVVGGDVTQHDFEYDEVRWFPAEGVLPVMAYENERHVAARAIEYLRALVGERSA